MKARPHIIPGPIAPLMVDIEPDEAVILVPEGVGFIRTIEPHDVRNAGERVTLFLDKNPIPAETAWGRDVKPGARVLMRSRFGWHEATAG